MKISLDNNQATNKSEILALLKLAKSWVVPVFQAILMLLAGLATLLVSASSDSTPQERTGEDKAYDDPKCFMNHRGDYCDESKSNWFY